MVVVNLRLETDRETEYVSFDRTRVLRVLAYITAELDEPAGFPISDEREAEVEAAGAPRVRRRQHRRSLTRRRND